MTLPSLERTCPRASLVSGRPSFIGEVVVEKALPQVRVQQIATPSRSHRLKLNPKEEHTVNSSGKTRTKKRPRSVQALPVIRPQVAGIDLGAKEHWVCGPSRQGGNPNVRVFGTTTPQLQKLVNWLRRQGVESVAMESTGVYWVPLYEMLEAQQDIEVVLVNARQLSHVPGRKTDMQDCQWLQLLHSCGLLRGSFRPSKAICELRALQRQYTNLVQERSKAIQWMQKALDQMNVQVHRALSDLSGKTGLAIVRAIVAGERDPMVLAGLRDKRCRKTPAQIAEHLCGHWKQEHLFNLKMALRLYDQLEEMLGTYQSRMHQQIQALQPPQRQAQEVPAHPNAAKEKAIRNRGEQQARNTLWRLAGVDLTHIDGISTGTAQVVFTEVGLDLGAFPTEKHFVSWLRLSPRTAFSAGKPVRKKASGIGATRLSGVLRMAALSLQNSKSALGAAFRRIARHKGGSVAVFAIARRLATLIYRMLRFGQDYVDEGAEAYERLFRQRRLHALRTSAKQMGYNLVASTEHG